MKVHTKENNSESQQHLEENKKHFSQQCLRVLELLRQGKRLTTANAPSYGILSLPRRIKDLRDHNGVEIAEAWRTDENGKKTIKEWFIHHKTKDHFDKFCASIKQPRPELQQLNLL